jgi:hypothetical protein
MRKRRRQRVVRIGSDAKALQILKRSGILNSDVTLDRIMKLSKDLKHLTVAPEAFIFRDFLITDP